MAAERPGKRRPSSLPLAFRDTSAIVPLCCRQTGSTLARQVMRLHAGQIVCWAASVEAVSAIYRLAREGLLESKTHPAINALEVSAALTWCGNHSRGRAFVCADGRLSDAARKEGFDVIRL